MGNLELVKMVEDMVLLRNNPESASPGALFGFYVRKTIFTRVSA